MKSISTILTVGGAIQGVAVGATSSFQRRGDRLFAGINYPVGWGTKKTSNTSIQRHQRTAILFPRGGDVDSAVVTKDEEDVTMQTSAAAEDEDRSLDDRVSAAMKRLGLEVEEELINEEH